MKRKVSCFFSLLMILLVFCTCLSPKAEEEMQTLVEAKKTTGSNAIRNISIGHIAIAWQDSPDTFYNIIEGSGWESGLRVAEIPLSYYSSDGGKVLLGPGTDYWYIYSASRVPVPGTTVMPVEEIWKGDDIYLVWSDTTIGSLEKLSNNMEVIQRSDNAVLISVWSATFPFFENRVWYLLRQWTGEDLRVYSLHDFQQFLEALPWISAIAAVLLCSLLLWAASWILLDKAGKRKRMLWLNGLLIAGFLGALPLLLGQFDLPASLMPQEFILDIPHYIKTFERIRTALDSMGYQPMLDSLEQAAATSWTVTGLSVLFTAAIAAAEGYVFHRVRKKELANRE